MKVTVQVESARHDNKKRSRLDDAWRLIETEWRASQQTGLEQGEVNRKRAWVEGAVAVLAAISGETETTLRNRLVPIVAGPVASVAATSVSSTPTGFPVFREGRSTPAPPRHPGAQRVID